MVKNRSKRYPTIDNLTEKINGLPLDLPIGKKFIYEDVILKVVKCNGQKEGCNNCFFQCIRCRNLACCPYERKGKTSVYFKKIN